MPGGYDVEVTVEGPLPPGHLEQETDYIEAVEAQMRKSVAQVQFAWRGKAQPSRRTGHYSDSIETSVELVGPQVVGDVVATAEYSEALETGRRAMLASEFGKRALKLPLDSRFPGRRTSNKNFVYTTHVKRAEGRFYAKRTYEETVPKVEAAMAKAGEMIVEKITARRGGL